MSPNPNPNLNPNPNSGEDHVPDAEHALAPLRRERYTLLRLDKRTAAIDQVEVVELHGRATLDQQQPREVLAIDVRAGPCAAQRQVEAGNSQLLAAE